MADETEKSSKFPVWAIVLIAVVVLVIILVIIGLVIWWVMSNKEEEIPPPKPLPPGPTGTTGATGATGATGIIGLPAVMGVETAMANEPESKNKYIDVDINNQQCITARNNNSIGWQIINNSKNAVSPSIRTYTGDRYNPTIKCNDEPYYGDGFVYVGPGKIVNWNDVKLPSGDYFTFYAQCRISIQCVGYGCSLPATTWQLSGYDPTSDYIRITINDDDTVSYKKITI